MGFFPPERLVLLGLAVLRAAFTAGTGIGIYGMVRRLTRRGWAAWVMALVAAVLMSLISADGIEHWLRGRIFGYSYNPFVSAIGEWEQYMGPSDPEHAAAWNRMKCGPPPRELPWWGDPGSGSFCR